MRSFGDVLSLPAAPAYPFRLWRRIAKHDLLLLPAPFPLADLVFALGLGRNRPLIVHWHADIVSHANAKAVHDCKRNLPDDLIRAVVEKGGVIGLNGFPAFVADKDAPTIDDLIDHLVHFDTIAGSGHVGLGLDYYQVPKATL